MGNSLPRAHHALAFASREALDGTYAATMREEFSGPLSRGGSGGMPEQPMPSLGFHGPQPFISTQASPLALIVAA